jgi:hypothetical protein
VTGVKWEVKDGKRGGTSEVRGRVSPSPMHTCIMHKKAAIPLQARDCGLFYVLV